MADAAQAGEHAVNTQARDSRQSNDSGGDAKADAAAAATAAATADAAASAADRSRSASAAARAATAAATQGTASAAPTSPAAADAAASAAGSGKSTSAAAPDPEGTSGGRSAAKSKSVAPAAGSAASPVTADPQALAMWLGANGVPTGGGVAATGAAGAHGPDTDSGVTGAVGAAAAAAAAAQLNQPMATAGSSLAGQSQRAGQSAQPGQVAQTASAAAMATTDDADPVISAAAAMQDSSAVLPDDVRDSPAHADQPAIMPGSVALPDLGGVLSAGAAPATPVDATVAVPVNNAGWPHAVAAQVNLFVANGVQSATLRLSPEHLGPVEVHIDVQSSQVNVNFSAAHAETRAALEQTVPRLRELFASGGLTLGQANVQADPRSGSQSAPVPVRTAFTQAPALEQIAATAARPLGLVDAYA